MKRFLYTDFYEAILHVTILALPFFISIFGEGFGDITIAGFASLVVSISGSIHSTRETYKDDGYKYNLRIKKEMIFSLIMLFVSICLAIVFLCKSWIAIGYIVLTFTYFLSVIPYFVEMVYVSRYDLNICNRNIGINIPPNSASGGFHFDVTTGNIN